MGYKYKNAELKYKYKPFCLCSLCQKRDSEIESKVSILPLHGSCDDTYKTSQAEWQSIDYAIRSNNRNNIHLGISKRQRIYTCSDIVQTVIR